MQTAQRQPPTRCDAGTCSLLWLEVAHRMPRFAGATYPKRSRKPNLSPGIARRAHARLRRRRGRRGAGAARAPAGASRAMRAIAAASSPSACCTATGSADVTAGRQARAERGELVEEVRGVRAERRERVDRYVMRADGLVDQVRRRELVDTSGEQVGRDAGQAVEELAEARRP